VRSRFLVCMFPLNSDGEIAHSQFIPHPVVVLSACDTACAPSTTSLLAGHDNDFPKGVVDIDLLLLLPVLLNPPNSALSKRTRGNTSTDDLTSGAYKRSP
jgi:hypothetical protein